MGRLQEAQPQLASATVTQRLPETWAPPLSTSHGWKPARLSHPSPLLHPEEKHYTCVVQAGSQ